MEDLLKPNTNELSDELVDELKELDFHSEHTSTKSLQSKNDTINPAFSTEKTNTTDTEDKPPYKHAEELHSTDELSLCTKELRSTEELHSTDKFSCSTQELCSLYGLFALK